MPAAFFGKCVPGSDRRTRLYNPTRMARASLAVPAFLLPLLCASSALAAPADQFSAALAKGPVYAGLGAFVSGFLVSLTPCVYPMVAVTVSVFGARQASTRT